MSNQQSPISIQPLRAMALLSELRSGGQVRAFVSTRFARHKAMRRCKRRADSSLCSEWQSWKWAGKWRRHTKTVMLTA